MTVRRIKADVLVPGKTVVAQTIATVFILNTMPLVTQQLKQEVLRKILAALDMPVRLRGSYHFNIRDIADSQDLRFPDVVILLTKGTAYIDRPCKTALPSLYRAGRVQPY